MNKVNCYHINNFIKIFSFIINMNANLVNNLEILAKYYKNEGDIFRSRAYQNAITSIKNLNFRIESIDQLNNVKGIGKTMREKIDEFLNTGKIAKVETIKKSISGKEKALDIFTKIWGVGPSKATELWNNGLKTINDVKKNSNLLTRNQKIGLKYYDELQQLLSRKYITVFQVIVRYILNKEFGRDSYTMEIAGSYRRKQEKSGDIDCLITSTKFTLDNMVNVLTHWNVITDVLSMRHEKFMGIAHCPNGHSDHFRLDIEFLPKEEWSTGLLYFTGSKTFNINMRNIARKSGYLLNQHGLYKNNKLIKTDSEQEIFDILNMKYIKPEFR